MSEFFWGKFRKFLMWNVKRSASFLLVRFLVDAIAKGRVTGRGIAEAIALFGC